MFLQNFGDVKNEVFEKKIAFFVFVFCMLEKEKQKKKKQTKWKRPKNPIKIGFFKVVIQICEKKKQKEWIFSTNCLTLFVSGRDTKNAHLRAHYLFWPKIFLDQNSVSQEKL